MNLSSKHYLLLLGKLQKRFIILVALVLIGMLVTQFPNPVTHECKPNLRTEMGLSSDGYLLNNGFCKEGYYPVLRFNQDESATSRVILLFVIIVPLLGLIPIVFLVLARKRNHR